MAEAEITGDADDGRRRLLVRGDGGDIEKESAENARARESSKGETVKSILDAGFMAISLAFPSLLPSLLHRGPLWMC
ncbi:hypothetical protein SLA2020_252450 [Shorea laevis]